MDKIDVDKLQNVPEDLRNLKSKVDKWNIDKVAPVHVDLSKLTSVVKIYVVKKDII